MYMISPSPAPPWMENNLSVCNLTGNKLHPPAATLATALSQTAELNNIPNTDTKIQAIGY